MKTLIKALATAAVILGAAPVQAAVQPTFVLVHGALFTEEGWAPLKAELEAKGEIVKTLNLPGRAGDGLDPRTIDIHVAAAKVCEVLSTVYGPKILVGHSQGGAVITQAFNDCGEEVKGLIFIAAVAPVDGETAFQGLDPSRDTNFNLCIELDADAGLFRLNRNGPLESSFFQDLRAVNPQLADQALASMVSEPIGIGTTKLTVDMDRYAKVAKFYVEATQDQVVSIETQRNFQAKVAFDKVYSLAASHSPMLSEPAATAAALRDAARLVRQNEASFDEILWDQTPTQMTLSPELAALDPRSAKIEVHYVRNQKFDVTLKLYGLGGDLIKTVSAPVTGTYSDWCNVGFFDAYDATTGTTLEVVDHSASQCSHTDRNLSYLILNSNGARSSFQGPGLVAHVPGF